MNWLCMQNEQKEDYLTKKAGDLAEKNIVIRDEKTTVADAAKIMRDQVF